MNELQQRRREDEILRGPGREVPPPAWAVQNLIVSLAFIGPSGITLTPGAKPRPAPAKVQCPRCRVWTASYCACGVKHGH